MVPGTVPFKYLVTCPVFPKIVLIGHQIDEGGVEDDLFVHTRAREGSSGTL